MKKTIIKSTLLVLLALSSAFQLCGCKDKASDNGDSGVQTTTILKPGDKKIDEPTVVDVFEGVEVTFESTLSNNAKIYPYVEAKLDTKNSPYPAQLFTDYSYKTTYFSVDRMEVTVTANVDNSSVKMYFQENNIVPESDTKVFVLKNEGIDTYLISKDLLTEEIQEQLIANAKSFLKDEINRKYTPFPEKTPNAELEVIEKYLYILSEDADLLDYSINIFQKPFILILKNVDNQFFVTASGAVISDTSVDENCEVISDYFSYDIAQYSDDIESARQRLQAYLERGIDIEKRNHLILEQID